MSAFRTLRDWNDTIMPRSSAAPPTERTSLSELALMSRQPDTLETMPLTSRNSEVPLWAAADPAGLPPRGGGRSGGSRLAGTEDGGGFGYSAAEVLGGGDIGFVHCLGSLVDIGLGSGTEIETEPVQVVF